MHCRLLRIHFVVVRYLLLIAPAVCAAQSLPIPAATYRPSDFNAAALLVIHYHRPDDNYTDWNVWSWPQGADGHAFAFDRGDSFGQIAIVPFAQKPARAGLIVRLGQWRQRDIDQDRYVAFGDADVREVWLVGGDETVYTDPSKIDLSMKLRATFLDARDGITLSATGPIDDATLRAASLSTSDGNPLDEHVTGETIDPDSSGMAVYDLKLAKPIDSREVGSLVIRVGNWPPQTVYARRVLDDPAFLATDATLGCQCTPTHATFATWSPVSSGVQLLLYPNLNSGRADRIIPMTPGDHGLWRTDVPGDLHGVSYRYRFTQYGQTNTAADIYCDAASANSSYSVAVDLDRLKPDGFDTVASPRIANPTDEIIYEIHTRDYSIADEDCPAALRGTYLGLIQSNPLQNGRTTRGLAHLKDLGITAVHLMPVEQFGGDPGQYNWGYSTSLFNVPEGAYSTAPSDPTRAILELRQAITALHENHIRVILDVVYNHTADAGPESPFQQTVRDYYFRTKATGALLNDTGVGNTLADERPMVRKYILDSLQHWIRDYHVDGFRFDLLGCEMPQTVQAICNSLAPCRPDLTLYGEPWTGGGTLHFPKGAQRGMHIAVFNDDFRNAIRGDLNGNAVGFATGSGDDLAAVRVGVDGAIDDFTNQPGESINYVSAHDDLTFWDKLTIAHPKASDDTKKSMQKLALGIVLTSQGIAFLHGGSDFCRTKHGVANSYSAGDAINAFDWRRKAQFQDVFDYVRGLIALRRAHPALRMSDAAEIRANLTFLNADPLVAYTLNGAATGDDWKTIFVAYNGQAAAQSVNLPPGAWSIATDDQTAGVKTLRRAQGQIQLPGFSMLVAHK
jgi:pullulanase